MRIACCLDLPESEIEAWCRALRDALPQASVESWRLRGSTADYAVVWRPSQEFFDAQPRLKAIFNAGAGVDALLELDLPPGAPLVRLEDAGMAEQMVEYVTYAVLGHFRDFDAYEADARAGRWNPRDPQRKADFPIGILGLGVLGSRVLYALTGLGFPVHAWSRSHRKHATFHDFLRDTRILVCMAPLTSETRGIINQESLALLRPNAYLINVARGGLVVESDLLVAVNSGALAGAMLDVFGEEPLPPEHPFWRHPKVIVTPHIAAATLRDESVTQIAEKILSLERGEAVSGIVEPDNGY